MTPREIRTAGWVNKRRSGQRRGYCDRGLRSMEFPGRCTRIGRTSIRISNDWVVQYRGHFLQLKPQNRRYGPTQSKALICEWEDGAVEVRYRNEGIEYEDLVLRPSVVTAPKARPHREPAQRRSKPAPNHPWREGHEERRKQLLLDRTQTSALIRASASASP